MNGPDYSSNQDFPHTKGMRIALITPHFPPMRTSAAVQMHDLALEMLAQGHFPTIIVPSSDIKQDYLAEKIDTIDVLRLKASAITQSTYSRRVLAEFRQPFMMIRGLKKSPLATTRWDQVVWYSPPIFFGPLIKHLKKKSNCRSYLILRDIFPEWALDLGILRKGPAYAVLKTAANYQYAQADVIGVQTPSNLPYMQKWSEKPGRKLEVLQNWLAPLNNTGCSINIAETKLRNRKIFVYIGNMGIAQGMDIMLDLATRFRDNTDTGFLFVGRGSEVERLRRLVDARALDNVLFCNEIDTTQIPGLLAQCHFGLLALDPRHKTHNIPGKFLSYLLAGLPVLARVSEGTDIATLINENNIGRAYMGEDVEEFHRLADQLRALGPEYKDISTTAQKLGEQWYSPVNAVNQITKEA